MDEERTSIPPAASLAAQLAALSKFARPRARRRPGRPRKGKRMRQLNYELKQMCQRNRDGSYATRADRERTRALIANQLHQTGHRHLYAASLRAKHVEVLVARWQAEKLSAGTLKNRMTQLRWWAQKVGNANVVARSNDAYGIADRVFVTNVSKARELTREQLERASDPYSRFSLRFQAAFGLRREESIKIRPEWADRGDKLLLKDTWTKGGLERDIPILTEEQRSVLAEAKTCVGQGSLIPANMSFIQQRNRFRSQCDQAGIHRVHGHRHWFAQERYRALTG